MLSKGQYITAAGSTMRVFGQHGGKSKVIFDWVEEDACIDCVLEPYDDDGYLVWHCEVCDGGKAKLNPVRWQGGQYVRG